MMMMLKAWLFLNENIVRDMAGGDVTGLRCSSYSCQGSDATEPDRVVNKGRSGVLYDPLGYSI